MKLQKINDWLNELIKSETDFRDPNERTEYAKGRIDAYLQLRALIQCLGAYESSLEHMAEKEREAYEAGRPWFVWGSHL